MKVATKKQPPKRSEGGGFIIKDILSGVGPTDPFLIWHELPREHYQPGEMPGAPLHPHRGMMECPYNKEMTPDAGAAAGGMNMRICAGGVEKRGLMGVGDFELGKVGVGMEHEALIDPRWSGHLHFFQLWVNLPGARKFDPPFFQNASDRQLPRVPVGEGGASVKVLHGDACGATSPTTCDDVAWQYMDFELPGGASIAHCPPATMSTRLAYVYAGRARFGAGADASVVEAGWVAVLDASSGGGELAVSNASESEPCGFMFCAGAPIGERVVQHGPFVMSSQEQIVQCFNDFQSGRLCPHPVKYQRYD